MFLSVAYQNNNISICIATAKEDQKLNVINNYTIQSENQLIDLSRLMNQISPEVKAELKDVVLDIGPANFTLIRSLICFFSGYSFFQNIKIHAVSNLITQIYDFKLNNLYDDNEILIIKKVSLNIFYSLFLNSNLKKIKLKSHDSRSLNDEIENKIIKTKEIRILTDLNDLIENDSLHVNPLFEYDAEKLLISHLHYNQNKNLRSILYSDSVAIEPFIPDMIYKKYKK